MSVQFLICRLQLQIIISQQPRDHLVDLQQRKIPPDTEMRAASELEHVSIHSLRFRFILQPSLWPECFYVFAEDFFVSMRYPRVDGNVRTAGKPGTVDLRTTRRNKASDVNTDCGTNAHGFFEAGLKVWQLLLRFVPLDLVR